jgi:hypothetical protein
VSNFWGSDQSLIWTFIYWLIHRIKKIKYFLEKIEKFLKALLTKSLKGWLNPKHHPWRFALLISIICGLIIAIVQSLEGLNLVALLKNGTITISRIITTSLLFISIEIFAVMSCFFVFGGFLGLHQIIFKKSLYF